MVFRLGAVCCGPVPAGPRRVILRRIHAVFQHATRAYCILLFACLLGPTVQADETTRDHDVVPEDYFTIGSISTVAALIESSP